MTRIDNSQKLFTAYQALTGRGGFVAKYEGFVSFVGGIRKMIEDQRVRRENKKAKSTPSTASDDRAPFCGGPSAPIDDEEAEAAKQLRMSEMKAKAAANKLKAARDEEESAAIRARRGIPSPVATGEAVRAGKSGILSGVGGDEKVSAIESIDVDA